MRSISDSNNQVPGTRSGRHCGDFGSTSRSGRIRNLYGNAGQGFCAIGFPIDFLTEAGSKRRRSRDLEVAGGFGGLGRGASGSSARRVGFVGRRLRQHPRSTGHRPEDGQQVNSPIQQCREFAGTSGRVKGKDAGNAERTSRSGAVSQTLGDD